MMKNDKIIVAVGVAVIVFAGIGIYYWVPDQAQAQSLDTNDFLTITGNLRDMPGSVTVSDSSPFYPLIATPVAINYDENAQQAVIPLYVMDFEKPSTAITRLQTQLRRSKASETIQDDESAKNASLRIAKKYWDSSEAVLLIEHTEQGYNLGVLATPIASYLRIPVIVTDKIDSDVTRVLNDLGVKKPLSVVKTSQDMVHL